MSQFQTETLSGFSRCWVRRRVAESLPPIPDIAEHSAASALVLCSGCNLVDLLTGRYRPRTLA